MTASAGLVPELGSRRYAHLCSEICTTCGRPCIIKVEQRPKSGRIPPHMDGLGHLW